MRVGIRLRLLGAFACLGAITLGLGIWTDRQIVLLGQIEAETFDQPLKAIDDIRSAAIVFEQLSNPTLAPEIAARKAAGDNAVDELFDELTAARHLASTPQAAALVDQAGWLTRLWLLHPSDSGATSLRETLEQAAERIASDGFEARARAARQELWERQLGAAVSGLAMVVSALLSLVMAARFVRPIEMATAVADRIASGNLKLAVPRGRDDEIGTLLQALGSMQGQIRHMLNAEKSRAATVEHRLNAMLTGSPEAMILLDADNRVLDSNAAARVMLALLGADPVPGTHFAALFADPAWPIRLSGTADIELPDGRWVAPSRQDLATGDSSLVFADITLRKRYETELEATAYRDKLTGLRNRNYFATQLGGEAGLPADAALLLFNVDRFRQINNIYGTATGDAVLVEVARRLAAHAGPADVCARIGSDEFALLLRGEALAARLAAAMAATTRALGAAVETAAGPVAISLRLGIAKAAAAEDGQALLREAKLALDRARLRGAGAIALFDDEMRAAARIRNVIERDLPRAIAEGAITLDYQPLVLLENGDTTGVEALARWRHPTLGAVPPMQFVAAAEDSGAIIPLGRLVLEQAAARAAQWADLAGGQFSVAVNLSPRQLADPRAIRDILDFLDRRADIAPRLKFEITEGILIDDPDAMVPLLHALKAGGAQLCLDDFGTGYSSLAYLHRFPFDVLKIDRAFVKDIDTDADARSLVRTIIELGRDLDMTLVAEGVETEAQAALLRALGAHVAQGYFFARPMAADQIPLFRARAAVT